MSIIDYYIEHFRNYFREDTLQDNIRHVDLESFRNHLMKKITRHKSKRLDASIREMAILRHIFTKAPEWDMIEAFTRGKSLLFKEGNQRIRCLKETD